MDKLDEKLVRILMYYYNDSFAYVVNENEKSDVFKTTIGVKQGGCLSPRLFRIYVEDVIPQIESLDFGVSLGNMKMGQKLL